MDARNIYHKIRAIAEPIHAWEDQMIAVAKWVESEFEHKPNNKVSNKKVIVKESKA